MVHPSGRREVAEAVIIGVICTIATELIVWGSRRAEEEYQERRRRTAKSRKGGNKKREGNGAK